MCRRFTGKTIAKNVVLVLPTDSNRLRTRKAACRSRTDYVPMKFWSETAVSSGGRLSMTIAPILLTKSERCRIGAEQTQLGARPNQSKNPKTPSLLLKARRAILKAGGATRDKKETKSAQICSSKSAWVMESCL